MQKRDRKKHLLHIYTMVEMFSPINIHESRNNVTASRMIQFFLNIVYARHLNLCLKPSIEKRETVKSNL